MCLLSFSPSFVTFRTQRCQPVHGAVLRTSHTPGTANRPGLGKILLHGVKASLQSQHLCLCSGPRWVGPGPHNAGGSPSALVGSQGQSVKGEDCNWVTKGGTLEGRGWPVVPVNAPDELSGPCQVILQSQWIRKTPVGCRAVKFCPHLTTEETAARSRRCPRSWI